MAQRRREEGGRAAAASREELRALLHESSEEALSALLENPRLDENLLCLLLERKELPGTLLEEVARRKQRIQSYRVKLRVARHPHTPRLVSITLVRQLYLFDLVNLTLLPSVPVELRRLAEELIISRLPQLPLGQKLTLARRGSARVAGALLGEGHRQVVPLALDNAFLTEAQLLKILSRESLPAHVVAGVARHRKWSNQHNTRMALVRHPLTPLAAVLSFLPDLTMRDLEDLVTMSTLPASLRQYLRQEIARRSGAAGDRTRAPR